MFFQAYALIEYKDSVSIDRLSSETNHFPNDMRIPIKTRSFVYRNKHGHVNSDLATNSFKRVVKNYGLCVLEDADLLKCSSVRKPNKT